jgi:hydrogenase-4 component E
MSVATLFETAMIVLILTNLALMVISRLGVLIRLMALQGALLALAPLFPLHQVSTHAVALCLAVLGIKAVAFPILLTRTLQKIEADTRIEPYLGVNLSAVAGIGGLLFALWLEVRLPLPPGLFAPLVFPAALTTIFTGLILVVSRKKALTQVIGYLAAENGIFLFGAPLAGQGSVWLELSILLDVFVGVFVMGIAIHHINKTFESIDVGRFCTLRD